MILNYNGDPSSTLAKVYNADKAEYDSIYRPLNREMIASVNSTDIIDNAKANAGNYYDNANAREGRMAERFGINYSAFEQAENTRRDTAGRGLNYDHIVNTSRMQQYERNNDIRNEMIGVGRGIDKSAYAQLESAANQQTQRDNANRQVSAQNSAAKTQMVGSAASMALMAFAMF